MIDCFNSTITRPHLRPGKPPVREGVKTVDRERRGTR